MTFCNRSASLSLSVLFCLNAFSAPRGPQVFGISHQSAPGYTRVILDVESAPRYTSAWLHNPDRLYLDFPDARFAPAVLNQVIDIDDRIVKRIRTSAAAPGQSRMVFDLNTPALLTVAQETNPLRLVLEITPRSAASKPAPPLPLVESTRVDLPPAPPQIAVASLPAPPAPQLPALPPVPPAVASTKTASAKNLVVTANARSVNIPHINRPPQIEDFLLHRPREAEATITDFRQREPGDGKPVTQPTTAYLAYDDSNLYVVFECRENPGAVRARMAKREDITENDRVAVYLDTFHDRQRAFMFASNALGVQRDTVVTEGQAADSRFDTVWYSKGQITPEGFVVWMAVPFKSLRYSSDSEQTWGIALSRSFVRNDENDFWPYITKRQAGFVQQMGELHGVRQIGVTRNIQFNPYVTGTRETVLRDPNYTTRTQGRVGGDFKAVIRNAFTLDATGNPDFSQVESDDPQVTINQRFEVYFPEKRPFFIENAGYFETPIRLFFSRRIADPLFGARFTGKSGPWNIGIITADDRGPGYTTSPSSSLYGARAHTGVLRVQREFGKQSRFGILASDWNFGSSDNRLLSADTRLNLGRNWFFTGQFAKSITRRPGGSTREGAAAIATIEHNGRHLSYSSSYSDRTPDFSARLGFIQRTDVRQVDDYVGYFWYPEGSKVISVGPSVSYSTVWNHQGKLTDWYANADFNISFSNSSGFHLTRSESYEFLGVRAYRGHRNGITFYSNASKRILLYGGFSRGAATNYNPAAGLQMFTGAVSDASFGFSLQASDRLNIQEFYFFDRMAGVYNSHNLRTKVNYQFTRALSARGILDYYGVLPNTYLFNAQVYKRLSPDILLTYMLTPGTAFYVGYNEGRENLQMQPNVSPYLYRNGPPGTLTGRQFFVKLSYLFRY